MMVQYDGLDGKMQHHLHTLQQLPAGFPGFYMHLLFLYE